MTPVAPERCHSRLSRFGASKTAPTAFLGSKSRTLAEMSTDVSFILDLL